jgi:CheY-like chemotaxis protein
MAAGSLARLKALIVEDNVHMRTLLKTLLRSLEIREVYEASDGEEGFDELHATRPDFVLSDLSMAPVDGLAFTRRVRTDPDSPDPHVPIIMVTGHTERKYIEAARDAGISELLAKPITPRNLYVRIIEIIERPRPFIRCDEFCGPDRRRRQAPNHDGPWRRAGDFGKHVDIR